MERLQKAGGIAALFEALLYVLGFVVLATVYPTDTDSWTTTQKLSFVLDNRAIDLFWALFSYAFSIVLIVLTVTLHERLKGNASVLMKIATPFGYIWAAFVIASGMIGQIGIATVARLHAENVDQALIVWTTITSLQNALGGGVELLGGVWVLLLSAVLFRTTERTRVLAVLGSIVGLAGVLTVLPELGVMTTIFGLSQIVWFAWIGIWLLRQR